MSGASHALDLCIALLGGHGKNMLMPKPGFPLYKTLCASYGVETRSYNLMPDNGWEVDVCHMQSLIDNNTVAIIYNNPSNPCGSVFSRTHILEILQVAQKNCIAIIADEIYENMVFPGEEFLPVASLTTEVPVLSCRGTTKRFLIPGMRLGWITVHDRKDRFGEPVCPIVQCLLDLRPLTFCCRCFKDSQWPEPALSANNGRQWHHSRCITIHSGRPAAKLFRRHN